MFSILMRGLVLTWYTQGKLIPLQLVLTLLDSMNINPMEGSLRGLTMVPALHRRWSKIDRCLINSLWATHFSSSGVEVLPQGLSDHTPIVISVSNSYTCRAPFRFCNYWVVNPAFKETLLKCWSIPRHGNPSFMLRRN
ncbi:hypothetical protein IFM89_008359 [Coptis chinensis]|uniref:Endonuclease/exonuclease/phosphatase domain-containing protein n=1 Tax=Coptis chinensis TaxID=261450 RepID=A0A835IBW7_9MAGN|nr:hypothetical protein IFM89_008359 [Coptis chinensis]